MQQHLAQNQSVFVHVEVYKAWAKNAIKKIVNAEKKPRVLSALGNIMYSRDCPLHAKPILWAKQQLEKLELNYINLTRFWEYLNQHWLPKVGMWCIGNQNIPHAGQDTNAIVESFHINMKRILYSFRERLIGCKMDSLIYNLVSDVLTHY